MLRHISDTQAFARQVDNYFGSDEEYARFQRAILVHPEAGRIVPGTGGARKVRWEDPSRRVGTRGGLRVIYFYLDDHAALVFVAVYRKSERPDLTADEKRALGRLSDELRAAFASKASQTSGKRKPR